MTEIERLEKTIFDLHGYKSTHSGSIAVHERFQGRPFGKALSKFLNYMVIRKPSSLTHGAIKRMMDRRAMLRF